MIGFAVGRCLEPEGEIHYLELNLGEVGEATLVVEYKNGRDESINGDPDHISSPNASEELPTATLAHNHLTRCFMWHPIAPSLERGSRAHGAVEGRFVTALRLSSGVLKCIDSTCYHAGGPLGLGDIEEVNGEACIKCPWHAYQVSLNDGGKFYEGLVLDQTTKKLVPSGWQKKQFAQRVHDIEERKDGSIWVKINSNEQKYDSDEYASSAVGAQRVQAGDVQGQKKGRDGNMPKSSISSGQVFAEQRWSKCKILDKMQDGTRGVCFKVTMSPLFKRKEYPLVMMNAKDLFDERFVVVRNPDTLVERCYTPVTDESDPDAASTMILSVRVYEQGNVSARLASLKVGDFVDMRKPRATDASNCDLGAFMSTDMFAPQKLKRVLLLAAGSGITSLFSVCQSVIHNTPEAVVTLVCFNHNPDTVMCRGIVARYSMANRSRVRLIHAFSDKVSADLVEGEHQAYDQTKLSAEFLQVVMSPHLQEAEERILVSWCGPPGFNEVVPAELHKAGFSHNCFLVPFVG